jgi:hypothetical protein
MTVRQNASTVHCGFLTEFDPWKIFVMFQAWWQIIYKIVSLTGSIYGNLGLPPPRTFRSQNQSSHGPRLL